MKLRPGCYEVGGLRFKRVKEKWPYRVLRRYCHQWETRPDDGQGWKPDLPRFIEDDDTKEPVAEFTQTGHVLLHPGYGWDGSSGAPDTIKCMRASALHDVWCQAMREGIFANTGKNWRRGAQEYRINCIADGMSELRAWVRYLAICAYSPFRSKK